MANQEKMSFADFRKRFNNEDACREYLYKLRWPERFVCPQCGGVDCYHIKGRNKYQCVQCRHQASVTSGTVMHKSKLSLQTWFWAIYLVSRDKRGYPPLSSQKSSTLPIVPPGICFTESAGRWPKEILNTCFRASSNWMTHTLERQLKVVSAAVELRRLK